MTAKAKDIVAALLLLALFTIGCKLSGVLNSNQPIQNANANRSANLNASAANTSAAPAAPDSDGLLSSGTGTEKEKPLAGKANVQGKVFFDSKPAAGITAKLCEKFNPYFGGCSGKTYTAKTDEAGEYLIKDVPPGIYEGLIVKVFDTPYYVFATSNYVNSAKYKVEADKTFFAPDTNIFKRDLKLQSPKAGAKISGDQIEVKWEAYPGAAYYKLDIFADTKTGAVVNYDYINMRVDGLSYTLDKPLAPGTYTSKVEAYNANDAKIAESADNIRFTVTGGAVK